LTRAYSGVATAAALAAVPGPIPGKKFSLGMGSGTFMDEKAWAVAFTADVKDYIRIRGGFGYGGDQATVNAGMSLSW
jgi:trimeric autotransporter adhesin